MLNKRFRDKNEKLVKSISEINKETLGDAKKYYAPGMLYIYEGKEYVLVNTDEELIQFKSWDGKNLFIPIESSGQFLPDVASCGMEIFLKFDTLQDAEEYFKLKKSFPYCFYIGDELFLQNEAYKNSCNELYESAFHHHFSCSYGNYEDVEERYKVNTYNFKKDEYLV